MHAANTSHTNFKCSLLTLPLNSLFIRAGEFWWVNDEVGKKTGWMKSKGVWEEDRLTPPLHGWQYWDGNKMQSDQTLECSREVSLVCREVRVDKLALLKCILDFKQIERR